MPRYCVNVTVEGWYVVEANTPEEAEEAIETLSILDLRVNQEYVTDVEPVES